MLNPKAYPKAELLSHLVLCSGREFASKIQCNAMKGEKEVKYSLQHNNCSVLIISPFSPPHFLFFLHSPRSILSCPLIPNTLLSATLFTFPLA